MLPFLGRHKVRGAPEQHEAAEIRVNANSALVATRLPKIESGTKVGTRARVSRGQHEGLGLWVGQAKRQLGQRGFLFSQGGVGFQDFQNQIVDVTKDVNKVGPFGIKIAEVSLAHGLFSRGVSLGGSPIGKAIRNSVLACNLARENSMKGDMCLLP